MSYMTGTLKLGTLQSNHNLKSPRVKGTLWHFPLHGIFLPLAHLNIIVVIHKTIIDIDKVMIITRVEKYHYFMRLYIFNQLYGLRGSDFG